MNRAQFMEQLEKLLSDISEEERLEALDYYNSYFDDAGEENEAEVIQELGSPGKVAAIIKADLKENSGDYGEYTEWGYEDTRTREPGQMPETYQGKKREENHSSQEKEAFGSDTGGRTFGRARAKADQGSTSAYEDNSSQERYERARRRAERGYHAEKKKNNAGIILVLILLVFISPFLSGAIGGVLGTIVAIILFPFILIFAFGICAVAFLIGGIACLAAGIALCVVHPAAGVLAIGIGCLLIAAGFLSLAGLTAIAGKLLPWLLNKFTDFCHNLLHREGKDGERV